jgi:hypothetical protein
VVKSPAICGHSARIGVPRSAAPLHGAQRVAPMGQSSWLIAGIVPGVALVDRFHHDTP